MVKHWELDGKSMGNRLKNYGKSLENLLEIYVTSIGESRIQKENLHMFFELNRKSHPGTPGDSARFFFMCFSNYVICLKIEELLTNSTIVKPSRMKAFLFIRYCTAEAEKKHWYWYL